MKDGNIKNIILDMGNVLLDYNPRIILDKVFSSEEDKELIYRELFLGEEWKKGDLGEIKNGQRYNSVSKRVPQRLHSGLKECVEHWDICMLPVNGAKEFCMRAKEKGYKIYILSNACSKFYEYFPKQFDMSFFDGIIVSSDVHIVKPDIRIYKYLLDKYSLKAEECLFIDDRQDNVEGARLSGMYAILFENNYGQIEKQLNIL